MNEKKNDLRSLAMFIASMFIFGTIGIFRRYIPLSSAMLACFRGLCGSLFLMIFILIRKHPFRNGIGWKKVVGLMITGAAIGLNWILLFEAYNYTTVATATLCYYMQPTIVVLLSPLVFKERLTGKKLMCAAAAVVGMIFVSGIADSGLPAVGDAKGIFFGLGAASLYSFVVIMNKKLPGIDSYEKTIIQLFSAGLVLLPYLALKEHFFIPQMGAGAIVMIVIVGLVHTGIAYAFYFGSMDGLKTQSIAILSYVDPVTALILSALFLHEPMTLLGTVGAVMILAAAFLGEVA